MKEVLVRFDETKSYHPGGFYVDLDRITSSRGVEVVRVKDVPQPLVQTFEVTITTPPEYGPEPYGRVRSTDVERLVQKNYTLRSVKAKETTP